MYPNISSTNNDISNKLDLDIGEVQDLNAKVESHQANTFFEDYLKAGSNSACFDCNQSDPQWVSVSHGILICFKCSGDHRSFGTHISVVKSTYLDEWTYKNLNKLSQAGNEAFLELFCSQDINPKELNMKQKQFSKLAQQYRSKLDALVNPNGIEAFQKPQNAADALEIVEEDPNPYGQVNSGISSDNIESRDPNMKTDYQETINEYANSSTEYLGQKQGELKETYYWQVAKEKLVGTKDYIQSKYEENKPWLNEKQESVSQFTAEKTEKIKNSETYKKTTSYVANQLSWLGSKAKSQWTGKNNEESDEENSGPQNA